MCGICGIWGSCNSEVINSMVSELQHRGPDDSGIFMDEKISLGMRRLAIIDLNPTGHQPMANHDKTIWIVYNGEVYNFQSERKLLEQKGYRFYSTSDTEVVLKLYEEYGDDFLLRLRGMFALAIYDKRKGYGKERLLLARDQLGIKPLLYAEVNGKIVFASEMKSLLASREIAREMDPVALRLLLTFGSIYQPHTMIKGVNMLLPSHRMIIENGTKRLERYWSLENNRYPELRNIDYPEQVEALSSALIESVHLQMVSDVPLGAFLSSGVDSSILVAIMAQQAGKRIKTFSVGFEAEGVGIDESKDAYNTANFLGTDHTHVVITGNEVKERLHHIVSALDQPSVDGVNSYFVSYAARQGMTVAISGTGGDELFAGYPWFRNMAFIENQKKSTFSNQMSQLACLPIFDRFPIAKIQKRITFERQRAIGFLDHYARQYNIFGSMNTSNLISDRLQRSAQAGRTEAQTLKAIDQLSKGSTIDRVTALCLRGYTANQLLRDIDAVSMSHSLEVRVPYLDVVLTDMALSLPDQTKINLDKLGDQDQTTYRSTGVKRILIDIGRPYLPKDFDIQPKRGFVMPFNSWLRGPLKEILLDTLAESRIQKRGWLRPEAVTSIKDGFLNGNLHWTKPWLLMMIELWATQFLDG